MGSLVQDAIFLQIAAADSVETVDVHEIVLKSIWLSGNKVVLVTWWTVSSKVSLPSCELK